MGVFGCTCMIRGLYHIQKTLHVKFFWAVLLYMIRAKVPRKRPKVPRNGLFWAQKFQKQAKSDQKMLIIYRAKTWFFVTNKGIFIFYWNLYLFFLYMCGHSRNKE